MPLVFAALAESRLECISQVQSPVTSTGHFVPVVVDVELCIGISGASGLKSNADKALSQDVVEHAGSQRAVPVEDLIDHVLCYSDKSPQLALPRDGSIARTSIVIVAGHQRREWPSPYLNDEYITEPKVIPEH